MPASAQIDTRNEQLNQCLSGMLQSKDPAQKTAFANRMGDYLRINMREEAFVDKFITTQTATADDLDIQYDNEMPVMIFHKEPGSPPAVTVGTGMFPDMYFIDTDRYLLQFQRLMSARFTKDVLRLYTTRYDVRKVVSDIAVNELAKHRDRRFINAVDTLVGTLDTPIAALGAPLNRSINGELSRDVFFQAYTTMGKTNAHIQPTKMLIPALLQARILAWGRDESGGDFSQEMLTEGWFVSKLASLGGLTIYSSIKSEITGDAVMRYFGPEDMLGQARELEPLTVWTDPAAFQLDFMMYMTQGTAIGNQAAVARVQVLP